MKYAIYQKDIDKYELSFSNGAIFSNLNYNEISLLEEILQSIGLEETTPNYMS